MKTVRLYKILTFSIGLLLFSTCDRTVSGGGSSTGNANTIAGIILGPGGSSPAVCYIHAYPSDSIPTRADNGTIASVAADTSDSNGNYLLENIPDGTYNLYCIDTSHYFSTLLTDKTLSNNKTLFTGPDTLRIQITLSGKVQNSSGLQTIAFVYGSPIFTAIDDTSGLFQLTGLPFDLDVPVSFSGTAPVDGKRCTAEYFVTQLPDTSRFVVITLDCE